MCAACNVHAELTSCGSFASLSPPVSEHLPGLPHETGRLITWARARVRAWARARAMVRTRVRAEVSAV